MLFVCVWLERENCIGEKKWKLWRKRVKNTGVSNKHLPVECRVLPLSVLSTVQVLSILINQPTDLIQAIAVHIVEKVGDLLFGE